jgi:hypothetical protein
MIAQTTLPGFGTATSCQASATHSPVPLRYVWHHVQPQEAGGATVAANLAQCCDSCHYSIHRLLWVMAQIAQQKPVTDVQRYDITHPPRKGQLKLASQGYDACVAAGTVAKIPNEG